MTVNRMGTAMVDGIDAHLGRLAGNCRACGAQLSQVFADLGSTPLCQSARLPEEMHLAEPCFPLIAFVCGRCLLVQVPSFVRPESIFTDYQYFSSFSDSWLAHAKRYVDEISKRLNLGPNSQVIELASNDGYLLQYFVAKQIPCLGIEPAANVAQAAEAKGIPTRVRFFGEQAAAELRSEGIQADLLLGNNVLAHTPDLLGFVSGMRTVLKPGGVITMEFPHLLRLMRENQFDTIYHEHYSYFSLLSASRVFQSQQLTIFDVEELPTHGGSLRIYACHQAEERKLSASAMKVLAEERSYGLHELAGYSPFAEQVRETKRKLLSFFIEAKRQGKHIVGYGAPGKGNTLLNYCGIRTDMLDYTVDRSPHKQGRLLPGTMIPIYAPQKIFETRPEYVLILPWNLKAEIMEQMAGIREWGGRFVVPIPEAAVLD